MSENKERSVKAEREVEKLEKVVRERRERKLRRKAVGE